MKELWGYYNILIHSNNNAALEKRMFGFLSRLFAPAVVSCVLTGALVSGLNVLLSYVFGIMSMIIAVYATALCYILSCGAPAAANLVPIGYKRRTAYFFICCIVVSVIFAAAFAAVFVASFSLTVFLVSGAGAFTGQVTEPTFVHPSAYLMLAGIALGNLGIGAMLGCTASTKAFWIRVACFALLAAVTIVTLLFAPAMEGASLNDSIEVDALVQIFNYLNNPWLFAGIYLGVYALIFAAGVRYMLKKNRPAQP